MLSPWGIRNFLVRQPKPRLIRLTTGDKVDEIKPTHGRSMAKLADTIGAVMPELIELYDGQGNLLRAMRPELESDSTSDPVPTPAPLREDTETARLQLFATLLAKAYEHTTNVAFTKMVELMQSFERRTEALEERLERTEGAYRRVMHEQLRDAFDQADAIAADGMNNTGEGEELVSTFLQGVARGIAEEKAKPKATNGKGA
jgi:hypothetical protein